jgi:hypothetical protein
MVPQPVALHPDPATLHVTPVVELPTTDACNCSVPPAATEELLGVTTTTMPDIIVMTADADLLGSATLVTTTFTVAGEGATIGALYTAETELLASVPQDDPLQPAPFKLHTTFVFVVPATVAVNELSPAAGTEALVGLMPSRMATAVTTVTFAEADLVGSATLVAVTWSVDGEGTLDGAVKSPAAEIVPHDRALQPAPPMVQVTAVFEDPVTVGANC